MAIEYGLDFSTGRDARSTLEGIADRFPLEPVRENFRGAGVLISADELHPRTRRHYEEDAGISPTVSLLFTLAKGELMEKGRLLTIRIVMDLLERETGDAALVQQGDGLLLLRKSGAVILSEDPGLLPEQDLQLFPTEWRRGPLPLL